MLEPPKGHGAIPAAQSPGQTQGSKGWEQTWQWDLCPCHGAVLGFAGSLSPCCGTVLGCDGGCCQCPCCAWGWNPAGSCMEQSFISKICRVSLATSGISFCQLAEIQMSLGCFFFFSCASHSGEKWLTCSMVFHGTDYCSWLMVPQAQSCLCFPLLGEWIQRC